MPQKCLIPCIDPEAGLDSSLRSPMSLDTGEKKCEAKLRSSSDRA